MSVVAGAIFRRHLFPRTAPVDRVLLSLNFPATNTLGEVLPLPCHHFGAEYGNETGKLGRLVALPTWAKVMELLRLVLVLGSLAAGHAVMQPTCHAQVVTKEMKDQQDQLIKAIRLGQTDEVKRLVEAGAPLHPLEKRDMSPLGHALDTGHKEVARYLIQQKPPFSTYYFHEHEFSMAAKTGDVQLAKQVAAELGFDLNNGDRDDFLQRKIMDGAIGNSIVRDHPQMLEYFVSEGYDISTFQPHMSSQSLMTRAAMFGAHECLDYLLKSGYDPNAHDAHGNTPLAQACLAHSPESVKVLLEGGAHPNLSMAGNPESSHYPITSYPLYTAVWTHQDDLVDMLLKAGAKPDIMNNAPIKLADMIGNRKIYDQLLAAGAPKPELYGFRDLATTLDPTQRRLFRGAGNTSREADQNLVALLNQSAVGKAQDTPPPALENEITAAVLVAGDGMEDLESLLTAKLSSQPKVRMLERQNIDSILKEKRLQDFTGEGHATLRQVGQLLGADALVILSRSEVGERDTVYHARIVHASTGIVADSLIWKKGKLSKEDAAKQIQQRFLANGSDLLLGVEEMVVLSVPKFSTSLSNAEARKLQRQLPLGLSQILSREDGVFLVERSMMESLQMEKSLSGDGRPFAASAWLTEGNLELPINERDRSLRLSLLLTSGNGRKESIEVSGTRDDLPKLLQQARDSVMHALGKKGAAAWNAQEEAEAYYQRARWYDKLDMVAEAESALQAAWALGRQGPEMEAALMHITLRRVYQAWELHRRLSINQLRGFDLYMAFRAGHLFPRISAYELTPEQYLERAHRLLDLYEPYLESASMTDTGQDNPVWYYGHIISGASKALEVLHSLSAEEEYGPELTCLRERLIGLTHRTFERIEQDWPRSSAAYNAVMINYLNWLSYWRTDEEEFVKEVEQILSKMATPKYRCSRNAVMEAMVKIGHDRMGKNSGRAVVAWQRLARRLVHSEELMPRLWAHAMLKGRGAWPGNPHYEAAIKLAGEFARTDDSYPNLTIRLGDLRELHPDSFQNGYLKLNKDWLREAVFGGSVGVFADRRQTYFDWVFASMDHIAETGSGYWAFPDYRRLEGVDDLPRLAKGFQEITMVLPEAVKHDALLQEKVLERFQYIQRNLDRLLPEDITEHATLRLTGFRPYAATGQFPAHGDEDRSPYEYDIKTVWYGGGIPWIYDAELGFVRIDPDGDLHDFVQLPDKEWQTVAKPRVSPVGITVAYYYREKGARCSGLAIYDFSAKAWSFLRLGPDVQTVHTLFLSEDHIAFSFESDPTDEQFRQVQDQTTERLKESTRGIMVINRETGAEKLLASTRRSPPESPLDDPKHFQFSLVPVSDHSFIVPKRHLYDLHKKEWRKPTKEERQTAQRANNGPPYMEAEGRRWRVQAKFGDQPVYIFTSKADQEGNRAPRKELKGKLDVDYSLPEELRKRLPTFPENVDPMKEGLKIRRLPGANLFYNGYGYFYLTDQELRFFISSALAE